MDFCLTGEVAGQPIWLWAAFLTFVIFVLWIDLGVVNTKDEVVSPGKSALMWGLFACCALAFGAYIYFIYDPDPSFYLTGNNVTAPSPEALRSQAVVQYFTGYLLETALAFDNIFVMSMVFAYFAIPREYQHRVLFWGILGAIVFRGIFIGLGAAVINSFTWILYLFAAFLIYSGWKTLKSMGEKPEAPDTSFVVNFLRRFAPVTNEITDHNFVRRMPVNGTGPMKLHITPLLIALATVEVVDIIFAVDSVPAIFAVTRDPFIVYTSNIFAILGLRSMYFMLAAAAERFAYLKIGLSLVLMLIGFKIIWNFLLHKQLHWVPYLEAHWSLLLTVIFLGGSMLLSLFKTRAPKDEPERTIQ
jgi:tellurite resistance protein TerC